MSDNLLKVSLDQPRIRGGSAVTATVDYTTDFGATLSISASNGFNVDPQSCYLAPGASPAGVGLTVTPMGALAGGAVCRLTFHFVFSALDAVVNVDP